MAQAHLEQLGQLAKDLCYSLGGEGGRRVLGYKKRKHATAFGGRGSEGGRRGLGYKRRSQEGGECEKRTHDYD